MFRQSVIVFVFCCSLLAHCIRDKFESACSKFHYDEQLLEKMIRLEIKFESLLEDIKKSEASIEFERQTLAEERLKETQELRIGLKNSTHDINSRLETLTKAFEDSERIFSRHITDVKELKDKEAMLSKDQVKSTAVAFEAHMVSADLSLILDPIIVFSKTKLDEGGAYDNTTGVFTAPVDGVYLVMVQFCLKPKKDIYFAIMVESSIGTSARLGSDSDDKYLCYTGQTAIKAMANSKVWVKNDSDQKDTLYTDIYRVNSFTGVLISTL